ncbi:TIGR04222 domain-containing membrane protein [Streptomyces sp. Je 1-369]|uniref:TIGR04222 domain-containing membrane protein n=1 Tax=Streptomyces sp. Je 1-369 TaxID=2966192 RepID=UPI0022865023|nr:TIGR04222 domain-containing membrane protein [Streptomyces sp. Je 1-369]WAL98507.1 TIGR04222 domain-containing membrane protein [Streptomyces sp. Je 1-369]
MTIVAMVYTVVVSLAAVELIRGVAAARRTGSPYRGRRPLDAEHGVHVRGTLEAAFLAGGPARAADALIAGLHEDGRLVVAGPGVVGITGSVGRNAAEQAVIDAHAAAPSGALHRLRMAVMRSLPVQETGEGLARRGLLVRPGRRRKWRVRAGRQIVLTFFGFVGCAVAALLLSADSLALPGGSGSPLVDILVLLPGALFGIVSGVICRGVTSKQLTVAGRYALRQYVASTRHLPGAAHQVATRGLSRAHPDIRSQLIAAARLPVPPAVPADPGRSGHRNAPAWNAQGGGTPAWCGLDAGDDSGGFACSGSGGPSCSGGGSSCGGGGGGGSSCGGGGGGSSCGGGGGGSS